MWGQLRGVWSGVYLIVGFEAFGYGILNILWHHAFETAVKEKMNVYRRTIMFATMSTFNYDIEANASEPQKLVARPVRVCYLEQKTSTDSRYWSVRIVLKVNIVTFFHRKKPENSF